jgi:[acyl-carrier-protein] S-malonyltransferase
MTIAILFPGQGSQEVGMGADLFDARPDLLGDLADEILGWPLRRVCLDGPIEDLTATDRAQPAIFALSYALWDELSKALSVAGLRPAGAAGHSLGEYTALAAAGYLDYQAGLRAVSARGTAMAAAAAIEPSGMAALLGVDEDDAESICAARRHGGGRLWVANLNAPGQIVVAGGDEDIAWLADNARDLGARRAIRLNVAGAFHSPFMQPAVDPFSTTLDSLTFADPGYPVWANVTAGPLDAAAAPRVLADQMVSPVRFAESLASMAASGMSDFVHVGPGDVTAGMARRCTDGAVHVVAGLDAIATVVDVIRNSDDA